MKQGPTYIQLFFNSLMSSYRVLVSLQTIMSELISHMTNKMISNNHHKDFHAPTERPHDFKCKWEDFVL